MVKSSFTKLKMFRFVVILLILGVVYCSEFKCGPGNECVCSNEDRNVSVTCAKTVATLSEICDFIGNSSGINITTLHATEFRIGTLFKGNLTGCDALRELILSNDGISSLEADTLENNENLLILDLSQNHLDVYKTQLNFTLPPKLRMLKLNGNLNGYLMDFYYPDLSNNAKLEILYLDGLPENKFPQSYSELKVLNSLTLSGHVGSCNLDHLKNTTFENLMSLKFLNISFCSIKSVEAGTFGSLRNLEYLDISGNMEMGIPLLSNVSFGLQFTNIKYLNYSKMHATFGQGITVRRQDFCYLYNTSLVELYADSNRIEVIEPNALILLPHTLTVLSTTDNIFSFGPYLLQLGCMPNLREFYGSFQNKLHDPRLFYKEQSVVNANDEIIFSMCPFMEYDFLKNISYTNKLCNFYERNISKETVPFIPETLESISFNDCNMQYELTSLVIFPFSGNLKFLDMSGNILYAWTGPILGPFTQLKYVDLSRNYCDRISRKFFSSFSSVETLHLDKNFIGLVLVDDDTGPYIFNDLHHLKKLILSSNKITYIPPTLLSNSASLEVLDLSSNNIEKWTLDTSNLRNLTHVNLSFNFISSFPRQFMDHFDDVSGHRQTNFTIDLSNNTIRFRCSLKYFLKWFVSHKQNMIGFDNYHFENEDDKPVSIDSFINLVNDIDKKCKEEINKLAIALGSTFGGLFLLSVTVFACIHFRYHIKYFVYSIRHPPRKYKKFKYDVFLSFSEADNDFAREIFEPKLKSFNKSVCIHYDAFKPGTTILHNIFIAVQDSEKTVVVLTNSYVDSCGYEFIFAAQESLHSRGGQDGLVVVQKEKDLDLKLFNNDMKFWYKSKRFIKYENNEDFWNMLINALNKQLILSGESSQHSSDKNSSYLPENSSNSSDGNSSCLPENSPYSSDGNSSCLPDEKSRLLGVQSSKQN